MTVRRLFLPLLLTAALVLSALGFGMARGQLPAAGEMVICSGEGIVTIGVDASGRPVRSHMLCPDAALAFFGAGAGAMPPVLPETIAARVWRDWPADAQAVAEALPGAQRARAPPA